MDVQLSRVAGVVRDDLVQAVAVDVDRLHRREPVGAGPDQRDLGSARQRAVAVPGQDQHGREVRVELGDVEDAVRVEVAGREHARAAGALQLGPEPAAAVIALIKRAFSLSFCCQNQKPFSRSGNNNQLHPKQQ